MNYYNEIDPFAVAWLNNLIAAGHIPMGIVDDRSIEDVRPSELAGFTQCHFFAGIGGWSLALRLAGWPDTRRAWTGSCPCQSFSAAGKGLGFDDPRHLWPSWNHLIAECKPEVVFGEQVSAAIRFDWIDVVQRDLESEDYTAWFGVYGTHSAGGPHIRQRVYWIGERTDSASSRHDGSFGQSESDSRNKARLFVSSANLEARERSYTAHPNGRRGVGGEKTGTWENGEWWRGLTGSSVTGVGSDAPLPASQRQRQFGGKILYEQESIQLGLDTATRGFWAGADWWYGSDEKYRPIEPGLFPLAHGVSNRVGRLRGYGNAISPPLAAEIVRAYLECRP